MASVNELAYTKMLLHAQQYPHCAVDGFCLGVRRGDGVEISDVVPGFHNGSLGGALEAAGAHAAAHAASQNLYVCGYYCAAAHLRDEALPKHAPSIAAALSSNSGGAPVVVLQISNRRLADPSDHALTCYGGSNCDQPRAWPAAGRRLVAAADAGVSAVDFDVHQVDGRSAKDWRLTRRNAESAASRWHFHWLIPDNTRPQTPKDTPVFASSIEHFLESRARRTSWFARPSVLRLAATHRSTLPGTARAARGSYGDALHGARRLRDLREIVEPGTHPRRHLHLHRRAAASAATGDPGARLPESAPAP